MTHKKGTLTLEQWRQGVEIFRSIDLELVQEFEDLEQQREEWEDKNQPSGFVNEGETSEPNSNPIFQECWAILTQIQIDKETMQDGFEQYTNIALPPSFNLDQTLKELALKVMELLSRVEKYQKERKPKNII